MRSDDSADLKEEIGREPGSNGDTYRFTSSVDIIVVLPLIIQLQCPIPQTPYRCHDILKGFDGGIVVCMKNQQPLPQTPPLQEVLQLLEQLGLVFNPPLVILDPPSPSDVVHPLIPLMQLRAHELMQRFVRTALAF